MKKLYILLIAVLFPASLLGQSGSGTSADPYYGIITTSVTWNTSSGASGTVYVGTIQRPINPNLTINSGGTLTINSGVTVIFTAATSQLIITGSGALIVNGTSSANVTFTKSPSKANWGDVYFNVSSGVSSINYCNISYGVASNQSFAGGGIYISNSSSVTIKNSTINNCSAQYGGGIEIESSSPVIENCVIRDNIGSGIDVFVGSPTITNCTIVGNTNSNPGEYGGIQNTGGSPTIKNCILWNNTGPGGTDYSGGGSISYSAATQAIPGTGMITLNSSNTNPAGPNFADPSSNNYSITSISPCRNAGTSTGAPATDILGLTRVVPYDIGAYEFLSNMWKTTASTTVWTNAANWNGGVPTGSSDIVIPAGATNYPISTPAPDFTLGAGSTMTLNPGAKATLGAFTNNGSLTLQSDATGSASFLASSYSGNDATVELFLTGGNPGAPTLKLNKWHFISTPVPTLPVSTFTSITQNIVGWYDNQVSGTLATGWIAFDGYRYSTGGLGGPTFSNLTPGNGYDYYAATDQKYTFPGQLNTSNVSMSLSLNVNDALHGFNLLGNPYSSGLNWDDIVNNVYFPFPANTSKSLYFTRDNAQCSYNGGVGIPSDVTGIIPPMQGFFVKTYGAGNTITIPSGARTQGSIHARYKGLEIIPLVRLTLTEGTLTDETVVRFDATAKSGIDYDFDAPKMFLSPDILSIYSVSDGSNFAINGQPFPQTSVEIPIVINLLAIGNNSIAATQLEGLDNYDVTLNDNVTGIITNLKTTPNLTFSGTAGTSSNRFILKVGTIPTGIENSLVSKNTFNIYPANSMINIQTISDAWEGKSGSVKIMDLTGRTIGSVDNSEFSKNSLTRIASPEKKGIYMVEIKSGMMRYVGKVVIK